MEFTIGDGTLIPGFEDAVVGLAPGESTTRTLPADDAYGPRHDEMVVTLDREQIPADLNPEVGDEYQIQDGGGNVLPVRVTATSDSTVTLDGNHPLAGEELTFEIELLDITEPAA